MKTLPLHRQLYLDQLVKEATAEGKTKAEFKALESLTTYEIHYLTLNGYTITYDDNHNMYIEWEM